MDEMVVSRRVSRRRLLQSAGGLSLGTLAIGSDLLGNASALASSQDGFEHSELRSRAIEDETYASQIRIVADDYTLGASQSLRVRDDRGQSVTLSPTGAGPIELGEVRLDIYRFDGTLVDEPVISVYNQEYPVDVSGDTGMFQTERVFTGYTVELVDGDTVLATTDERVYGIGYHLDITQEGTSGEIELSFPAHPEVQDSWVIELSIVAYDDGGRIVDELATEFERDGDRYRTVFDEGSLAELPEDAHRNFDVNFYVDGDPTTGAPNLWAGADVTIEPGSGEDTDDDGDGGDDAGGDETAGDEAGSDTDDGDGSERDGDDEETGDTGTEGGDERGDDGSTGDETGNRTGDGGDDGTETDGGGTAGSNETADEGADDDGAQSWLWVIAGGLGMVVYSRTLESRRAGGGE